MKNTTSLLSLATILLLVTAACSSPEPDSITSRTYDVSDFNSLNLELIGDVIYVQSDSSYLNASGSSNLIDALKVSDSKGKLSVILNDKQKFSNSKKELLIKVGSPNLKAINLETIGKLHLKNNFQGDKLEITNKGIGTITIDDCHVNTFNLNSKSVGTIDVKGSTSNVNITSDGVGNIDCEALKATHAKVEGKGTGNISVYASESIVINLKGIGNVKYYGNPASVKTDIKGLGKAKSMDS